MVLKQPAEEAVEALQALRTALSHIPLPHSYGPPTTLADHHRRLLAALEEDLATLAVGS